MKGVWVVCVESMKPKCIKNEMKNLYCVPRMHRSSVKEGRVGSKRGVSCESIKKRPKRQ